MDTNLAALNQARGALIDMAVRFGPKILIAVLILIGGGLVGRWCGRAIERGLSRLELEPPVRLLLVRLVKVLVFMLFFILALENLGVELLPLIAGLSVAGAGIALATQGILSNVVAGLTIIFTKPYRVGDYIEIVGVQGQVQFITMFSTTLLHLDRSRVVVPNRKVVGEILHNYGQIRQLEVKVGVAYEADLTEAMSVIRELVAANPRVLRDPEPVVQIVALADSMVQIALKPWVAVGDFASAGGELSLAVVQTCRERGIEIPYPHRQVQLIGTPSADADQSRSASR
ncbi:MAG TPA: mechanosensitive ion channel domain-containing protein [Steroidobacteraceae bacterium]|jgi:small conductance mechanosensitive channel